MAIREQGPAFVHGLSPPISRWIVWMMMNFAMLSSSSRNRPANPGSKGETSLELHNIFWGTCPAFSKKRSVLQTPDPVSGAGRCTSRAASHSRPPRDIHSRSDKRHGEPQPWLTQILVWIVCTRRYFTHVFASYLVACGVVRKKSDPTPHSQRHVR
jgi:hypothetical protein